MKRTPLTPAQRRTIAAATIGAVLEWFDLLVYAFFAVILSRQFFPTTDATVSLLLSLGTFALAWLVREILAEGADQQELEAHSSAGDVAALRGAVAPFTRERASTQTGLSAEALTARWRNLPDVKYEALRRDIDEVVDTALGDP